MPFDDDSDFFATATEESREAEDAKPTPRQVRQHLAALAGAYGLPAPLVHAVAQTGGGFDTAQYDKSAAGNSDYEDYYAYGRIRQETRLFWHSLTIARENLLGGNANNLRTTYGRYTISSPVVANLELQANLSLNFAEEFGGTFRENFTYYGAGLRAEWQFHKYLRAVLSYEFRLKESDLALRDFHRNRVTLAANYSF